MLDLEIIKSDNKITKQEVCSLHAWKNKKEKLQMKNNEMMTYDVIDSMSTSSGVSGAELVTGMLSVIPNACAAPFQRYHEVNVKSGVIKEMMNHQTEERKDLCDLMIELADRNQLDDSKFQTIAALYSMKRF